MGTRLNLGCGYGIVLSESERKKASPSKIDKKINAYIKEGIEKAYEYLKRDTHEVKNKDEEFFDEMDNALFWADYIDVTESKKQNKLLLKENKDFEDINRDIFLYPSEGGSNAFLGYISDAHYDDDTCYAMIYPLKKLGVAKTGMKPFEMLIPATDPVEILSIENDVKEKDGRMPRYIPNPEFISKCPPIYKDFAKLLKKASEERTEIPFKTREECDTFVNVTAKQNTWITTSLYYLGLELVKVIFPEKTFADIERYLVGWWC